MMTGMRQCSASLHMLLCMLFSQSPSCIVLQIRVQSENDADDELLSVAVMKGNKKVVAGTQSGVVNLYSWGHLEDCSDRFPGAPLLLPLLCCDTLCNPFLPANFSACRSCTVHCSLLAD